jgi:hypothetical protein
MDKTVSSTTLDLQALTQDAAINQTASNSGHDRNASNNPTGQYASGLMDELFGEVDGILDGSLIPPSEPLKVPAPAEPKAHINLDFAAFLSTPVTERAAMMADLSTNGASPTTIPQDREITPVPTETVRIQARQESYGLFEKLLIFVGCSSAMAAMVIWLGSQGTIGRMVASIRGTTETTAVTPPSNPSDSKFADYMGKSLDSIDNKNKVSSGLPTLPTLATMPTVKVPGSPSATSPQPSIIIGGSGLPKPKVPVMNSGVAMPGVATPAPAQNTLEQTVAKLSNLVDRMSRPVAPAPIAAAPVVRSASTPGLAVAPAAPAPERTLKGILGNGDRSAVMFELNGVTKNYEKGEKIGNSGWVLIRVENGNAIVRRNGEVRTLSVGQRI